MRRRTGVGTELRSRSRKPWWLRRRRGPLTDLYAPSFVRVWLVPDGDRFEEAGEADHGEVPEWYGRDAMELGWDGIFQSYGRTHSGDFPHDLLFLLDHGLAPDQPFLVHLEAPHWYRSSYEYSEWDCEWTWDIIDRVPLAPETAAKRWEEALRSEQAWRKAKAEREAQHRFLSRSQRDAMFIRMCWYFGNGQSWYDEMSAPRALRLSLCSSVSWHKPRPVKLEKKNHCYEIGATLVSGEDDQGDHETAMKALVKNAAKELPGLEEAFIRKLPVQGDW